MYRYQHVTITYALPTFDPRAIEPILNQISRDWMRYAPNCLVLWTDKSNVTVSEMIRTALTAADYVLVTTINLSEAPSGWQLPWVWEWMNRARDHVSGWVHLPAGHTPEPQSLSNPDHNWVNALIGLIPPPGDQKK